MPVARTGAARHRTRTLIVLATALLLLVPLIAMQFTDEVQWDAADFIAAGALLLGAGLAWELLTTRADTRAQRAAAGIAVVAALLLVWINLAVGIIGSEEDPINLMYFAVVAVGLVGATVARLQPRGMARALSAMALTQALATIIALAVLGSHRAPVASLTGAFVFNAVFVALFAGSAFLFRRAHADQRRAQNGR